MIELSASILKWKLFTNEKGSNCQVFSQAMTLTQQKRLVFSIAQVRLGLSQTLTSWKHASLWEPEKACGPVIGISSLAVCFLINCLSEYTHEKANIFKIHSSIWSELLADFKYSETSILGILECIKVFVGHHLWTRHCSTYKRMQE